MMKKDSPVLHSPTMADSPEAPVSPKPLLPMQLRFCEEYIKDLNPAKAYIRAGYLPGSASESASRLMADPRIKEEIDRLEAPRISAADVTAIAILRQLMRIADCDARGLFDPDGNLKPPQEWTVEQGQALASFEVIKKNAAAGDGLIDTVHRVKFIDKTKALDLLSKHLGLLIDRVEHSGSVDLKLADADLLAKVAAARAKLADGA